VTNDTYYDLLGVRPSATPVEIKAAHRQQIARVHPDLGGAPALFRMVQTAFDTLSDDQRRVDYDQSISDKGMWTAGSTPSHCQKREGRQQAAPDVLEARAKLLGESAARLLQLAASDRDRLEAFRVQLEWHQACLAVHVARERWWRIRGPVEMVGRYDAVIVQLRQTMIPSTKLLITATFQLIGAKAAASKVLPTPNTGSVFCHACKSTTSITPGTTAFRCSGCARLSRLTKCGGCGSFAHTANKERRSSDTFTCRTCRVSDRMPVRS